MARTHSACATCRMNQECKECYYQSLKEACRMIHQIRLASGGDRLTVENWIEKIMYKVHDEL